MTREEQRAGAVRPKHGADPGRVSGAIILDQLELSKEMLGRDVVASALRHLPREVRAELDSLLPMSWCRIATALAIHQAIADQIGQDLKAWHRTIVGAGIERTLTTVWRFFMRLTTAEAMVKRAASIYAQSYDRGAVRAALVAPNLVEVVLSEWPDVPDTELDAMAYGLDTILNIAKKKHSRIVVERRPGGARFEVRLR